MKILLKSGLDAARATATYDAREISWTTDTKKLFVGATEVGKLYDARNVLMTGFQKLAAGGPIVTTDNINQALGKVEADLKNAVAGGGDANVQSNWDETSAGSDAYILHKPLIINNLTTGGAPGAKAVLAASQGPLIHAATAANAAAIALLKKFGKYVGTYDSEAARDAAVTSPNDGDYCLITKDGNGKPPYYEYIYDGATSTWEMGGELVNHPHSIHVEDVLTSTSRVHALSANMGKTLKDLIDTPTTFAGLSDTMISLPSDGDITVYTHGHWVNKDSIDLGTY